MRALAMQVPCQAAHTSDHCCHDRHAPCRFNQVFFGNSPDTYYTGCCSSANCLWTTASRWTYADVSACTKSPSGAYLVFDVSAAGYAVVVTNPNGRGPQAAEA